MKYKNLKSKKRTAIPAVLVNLENMQVPENIFRRSYFKKLSVSAVLKEEPTRTAEKCSLHFIFILFLSIMKISLLQGACFDLEKEEGTKIASRYQRLSIDEKLDNSSSGILTELDSQSPNNAPISWLLIESDSQSNERIEENILSHRPHDISDSYMLAFQDDYEENISKLLAFKYIASLIVGFGPSIPQIAIALRIGEYYRSTLFGYFLVATTILTIEGITSWMIWELIEDTQKFVKTSKQHQTNSNVFIKAIGIGTLSFVLGALSSAPDVYKTYKYNEIKELSIISFIYDTIPRTLGFYKLFSSLNCKLNNVCKEKSIVKSRGVEFINLSKAYFLNQCKEKDITNVSATLKHYETPKEVYSYLSSSFQENVIEENLPYYYAKDVPKNISKYLALIFPLASAGFNMVLAYNGYNLFIDNQILLGLLSGFSVMPTFVLSSYVIMQASGNLFDKIYLHKSKIPSSNYFSTFHPKMNIAFMSTSLLLGAATSVSGLYLISDNLENTFLSPVKYVFATLAVVTDITFGTYTIYSSLINFGEAIEKKCNKKSSYILSCLKKLDDIRDSIVNSNSDIVENFVNEMDPHPAEAM